jgi:hypothetical protein
MHIYDNSSLNSSHNENFSGKRRRENQAYSIFNKFFPKIVSFIR